MEGRKEFNGSTGVRNNRNPWLGAKELFLEISHGLSKVERSRPGVVEPLGFRSNGCLA